MIVPTFNEVAGLDTLVSDLLAQDYPALEEIWFIDGCSTDGTHERLRELAVRDARIRIAENRQRITAAAINLGFERATGDVVMRIDAHARYGPAVVRQCVEALLRTGAGGVGMIARPARARSVVARAIVAAHQSPLGIGVARFRREGGECWAATIWNGCYWRFIIDRAGPLRDDLVRVEDNEFNARVRAQGYGLYVIASAQAFYQPRTTLGGLAAQYGGNGRGVARALLACPGVIQLHHLAPFALVMVLLTLAMAALVWSPAVGVLTGVITLCAVGLVISMALAWRVEPGPHVLLLPIVLAVLHLSYGFGTLMVLAHRATLLSKWPRPRTASAPDGSVTGEPVVPLRLRDS